LDDFSFLKWVDGSGSGWCSGMWVGLGWSGYLYFLSYF
jgi:hypothetical protein